MALQLWETLKEAVTAYNRLSPAAFFTLLALAVAVYYVVSSFFFSPDDHRSRSFEEMPRMEPLPPPVQLGEITEGDLKQYDGSDPKKPLLMAIKGQIYDVSQSRMFYGPGGPYALFAGKDASRALAKLSFEPVDLTSDLSGLGPFELEALQDWEYKFMSKYVKVGTIKKDNIQETEGEAREGSKSSETKEEEERSSKAGSAEDPSRSMEKEAEENPDEPSRMAGEEDIGKADGSSRIAGNENNRTPEEKTGANGHSKE